MQSLGPFVEVIKLNEVESNSVEWYRIRTIKI